MRKENQDIYIVYKTTNMVNGRYYIGVTSRYNSDYIGSGIALRAAVEKYGRENFVRETLFAFEGENAKNLAYEKESELVTQEVCDSLETYNVKIGGFGGWEHVNNSGRPNPMKGRKRTKEERKKMSDGLKRYLEKNGPYFKGRKHSKESLEKMAAAQRGKVMPEEVKKKISRANSGVNNFFYGKKHTKEVVDSMKLRAKPVEVNGVCYRTTRIACEAEGVTYDCGKDRINSKYENGWNWAKSEHKREKLPAIVRNPKRMCINGIDYPSLTDASRELNLSIQTISGRLSSKNFIEYNYIPDDT